MRKSSQVLLTLVTSVALATLAVGCDDGYEQQNVQLKRCVKNGVVVPERECEKCCGSDTRAHASGGVRPGYAHWYYGGSGMNFGDRVTGGGIHPAATMPIIGRSQFGSVTRTGGGFSRSVSVSRGGFGGSFGGGFGG